MRERRWWLAAATAATLAASCHLVAGLDQYQVGPIGLPGGTGGSGASASGGAAGAGGVGGDGGSIYLGNIVQLAFGDAADQRDPRLAIAGEVITVIGTFGGTIDPGGEQPVQDAGASDRSVFGIAFYPSGETILAYSFPTEAENPVGAVTADGGFLFAATLFSDITIEAETSVPAAGRAPNVFFAAFSSDAALIGSEVYNDSPGDTRIAAIAALPGDAAVLAGRYDTQVNFGTPAGHLNAFAQPAGYVVKIPYGASGAGGAGGMGGSGGAGGDGGSGANGPFAEWHVALDGTSGSEAVQVTDVATSGDGDVYFVGSMRGVITMDPTVGLDTFELDTADQTAGFVGKVDGTGQGELFVQLTGSGSSSVVARAVAIGPANEVAVVGDFRGTLEIGSLDESNTFDTPHDSDGGGDVFVVKYGSDDEIRWTQRLDSGEADDGCAVARAVVVDDDGHVIVAGDFRGTLTAGGMMHTAAGPPEPAVAGSGDLFLIKLRGSDGEPMAFRKFGGPPLQRMTDVEVLRTGPRTGSVVIAGEFTGQLSFGPLRPLDAGDSGSLDVFVAIIPPERFGSP